MLNAILIPNKCVFDLDAKPVEESFLKRIIKGKITIENQSDTKNDSFREGSYLEYTSGFFGGYKNNHYGHFLLESLGRLQTVRETKEKNIFWINLKGNGDFSDWQLEILTLLGMHEFNHILIKEPTLVKNLIISPPEYVISDKFTTYHNAFLSVVDSKVIPGKKVWISRKYIEGGWVNEVEIENYLSRIGWMIFHPERHSVGEQLSVLSESEIIAGTVGSAFHTLVLLKNVKSRVIIFSKNDGGMNDVNNNYQLIAHIKKINQEVVHVPQVKLEGTGIKTKYYVDTIAVLSYLDSAVKKEDSYYNYLEKHIRSTTITTQNEAINLIYFLAEYFKRREKNNFALKLVKMASELRPDGLMIKRLLKSLT